MNITNQEIEKYCEMHTSALSELFDELKSITYANTSAPNMQVGRIEARFLRFLIKLSGAKKILEIGTFTGFSALAMAEALPADGEVTTCEIDPRPLLVANVFWSRSAHGNKIKAIEGPALETIEKLPKGSFDFIFIDADKNNYPAYWRHALQLISPTGLIVIDNVLWGGKVLNTNSTDKRDIAVQELNELAINHPDLEVVMLPIRDGILLARYKD